jgi:FkbM family methyltransferase
MFCTNFSRAAGVSWLHNLVFANIASVRTSGIGVVGLSELHLTDLARMPRQAAERAIRARVQTAYLGDKLILARMLGRPKILLSTDDLGFSCHLMLDGYWEIWLTQFFARVIAPGMTVIDVGANFGYYTVLFGEAVGHSGRVIAIEPVPSTAAALRKTIDLNGLTRFTHPVIAAAGDRDDAEVHMVIPPGEPKNATVVAAPQEGSIVVPSVTIDRLTRDLDRLDIVKIDAEGAEQSIFAGMKKTIERFKPRILLEFNAARYPDAGAFLGEIERSYPRVRSIDFNGNPHAITRDAILHTRFGEDWLLYLDT